MAIESEATVDKFLTHVAHSVKDDPFLWIL
jgi:hypothetical protein